MFSYCVLPVSDMHSWSMLCRVTCQATPGAHTVSIFPDALALCRSRDIPDLHKDRGLKKLVGFDAQKFSQAPAHVMHATLQHLRTKYGSARKYLAEACGFTIREQQLLGQCLRTGNSLL